MQTTQVINDHHHQPHHNHHTNGKLNGYQKGSNGSTVDPQTQTPQPPPTNGYNSNGRRDSGNVWLPLLPNDISINSDHLNSPSNNNDWKDT
uniref:Uncharacterized protein n=1 Tax=Megaselia scalaris TaxID=36166 RepID=T1GEZ5_MEGSC